jgi:hypothetical protein
MAARLSKFTAGELARAAGTALGRGRPSAATRASLEATVQDRIDRGTVTVKKGKLVRI